MNPDEKILDVVILGAGTAGLSAQPEVAKKTDNYLVIDSGPLGTTCARVGCMPSKALIQIADDFHRRLKFQEMGIQGSHYLSIDTTLALKEVRKLRDYFVKSVVKNMGSWIHSHFIQGKAQFINENQLEVNGKIITSRKIIIATGSHPDVPEKWKAYSDYLITTDQIFELTSLPKKAAVIGLGTIGLELGQALHRLGIDVILIGDSPRLGGLSDPEMQKNAIHYFSNEIPLSLEGAEIASASHNEITLRSGHHEYTVEKVFVCTGRTPNLETLNLKALHLNLNSRGVPRYDRNTMRIWGTSIYIAGDVDDDASLLHVAAEEGRIAGYNSVLEMDQSLRRKTSFTIVFSSPQIARVGESYESLKASNPVIGQASFEAQSRAVLMHEGKGLIRIYANRLNGQLLGAEMIAPGAEHLAHLLAWAIDLKLTVSQILNLPFYHPVLEEGIQIALEDARMQLESRWKMKFLGRSFIALCPKTPRETG